MSLYDDLGAKPDATAQEIKDTYRKRARETHPDKGGDTATFQLVAAAYDVLGSPERRKRYDETGDTTPASDAHASRLNVIAGMVIDAIESASNVEHTNLLDGVRQNIRDGIDKGQQAIDTLSGKIIKRERAHKRLSKKIGTNFIGMVIDGDIENLKKQCQQIKAHIQDAEEMLVLLDEYSYQCDVQVAPPGNQSVCSIGRAWSVANEIIL